MSQAHVSEKNIKAGTVGGLLFGVDQALLENADLGSTLAAAKTAIDVDNAKLHVSQRTFGARVKASLDMVGNYDSSYIGGSDAQKASMLALTEKPYRGRTLVF